LQREVDLSRDQPILDLGGGTVSTLAVIVIVVVALLLLTMLVAGRHQAARVRTTHESDHPDDLPESRSHAEASRRGDAERL
jgi:hypothetical protein